MIQIQSLAKSYDTVQAIVDLDLAVGEGQTLGLIGPNGSGKTTLLRMLATLAKPDHGEVRVAGFDARRDPREVRRRIAFMPAEFGMPADMTIAEYLDYFARLGGVPGRQRPTMIDEVLELTDLKGREDVLVRGLSTGNKQRVLLAKTLLGDRPLLLLDEPASGLDPRARSEVRAILRELAQMGRTIVISSHILADLEDICSHICILEAGRAVLQGSMDELRNRFREAERIVQLYVPAADLERAATLVAGLEDVIACRVVDHHLQMTSERLNSNYILRALIEADIEILGMEEEKPDLEAIFIRSTQGQVT